MEYVYFIDDENGLTKIGRTKKHPSKRLKEFQIPNLSLRFFYETKYSSKLEVALHKRYKHNLIGREWFNLSEYNNDHILNSCKVLNNGINLIINNKYI